MIKVIYTTPATYMTGNLPLTPVSAAATVTGAISSLLAGTPESEQLLTFFRGKFLAGQINAGDVLDATHDGQTWTVYKNNVLMGTLAR